MPYLSSAPSEKKQIWKDLVGHLQSWKKRLGQFVWFGSKTLPLSPQCSVSPESCCQRPRQVAQHWLMGGGEGNDKWELGGIFKTMHCPKCPYNREHWDNCSKVGQVSQLFFFQDYRYVASKIGPPTTKFWCSQSKSQVFKCILRVRAVNPNAMCKLLLCESFVSVTQ